MQRIDPLHLLLVLIVSQLGAAADYRCPEGWHMKDSIGQCVYGGDDDDASENCEALKTELYRVVSVKKQSLVLSLIIHHGHKCKGNEICLEYWISIVESKEDDLDDNTPFWEINFRTDKRSCVVIRIQPSTKLHTRGGSWVVEDCIKAIRYICSPHSIPQVDHKITTPKPTPVTTTRRYRPIPKKYYLVDKRLNWEDAFAECADRGKMAFIVSSQENDAVSRYLKSLPQNIIAKCVDSDSEFHGWLGGRRHTCSEPLYWISSKTEENWLMEYFNWSKDEPNCLYSGEHCVAFTKQGDTVKWRDDNCLTQRCPLCESLK